MHNNSIEAIAPDVAALDVSPPISSFAPLGLSEQILRALTEKGYSEPTPIQLRAIPAVLSGADLLAGAQTGTGKTAGFVLPLLQKLSIGSTAKRSGGVRSIRALVLAPTRELAAQVAESVVSYSKYLNLSSTAVFGGVNINPQINRLRRGVDVLVATPGRLLDHAQMRTVDLSKVEILVLDEADRMLDMGFIHDIRRIMKLLPEKRQSLLFSATFSDAVRSFASGLLDQPVLIEVAKRNTTAETVIQKVFLVDRVKKRELLEHLIKVHNWSQVLVFTRTKFGANRLSEQLSRDGVSSSAIHGNKSQGARMRALSDFKSAALQVLVATDIAARGLDIAELPHVVNFDLPNVPEDYVHRIGRTGRAGSHGEAISLVSPDEKGLLRDIERVIRRSLPKEVIAGFELDPNASQEDEDGFPMRRNGPSRNSPRNGSPPRAWGGGGPARSNGGVRGASGDRPGAGFAPGGGGNGGGGSGGGGWQKKSFSRNLNTSMPNSGSTYASAGSARRRPRVTRRPGG